MKISDYEDKIEVLDVPTLGRTFVNRFEDKIPVVHIIDRVVENARHVEITRCNRVTRYLVWVNERGLISPDGKFLGNLKRCKRCGSLEDFEKVVEVRTEWRRKASLKNQAIEIERGVRLNWDQVGRDIEKMIDDAAKDAKDEIFDVGVWELLEFIGGDRR